MSAPVWAEYQREYTDADLTMAITWAAEAFDGKRDRQGKPAILHALRVMLAGKDNAERIVGVLHDLLEDTDCRGDDIRADFGDEIAFAVECLTRHKSRQTYEQYIASLIPWPLARAVKLNDLTDNLARCHELPEPERTSLAARYRKALSRLSAAPSPIAQTEPT